MGSVFSVSSLVRLRSGAWRSRKAIPATVRAEYQRLYGGPQARSGKAWEAIFSEPASTPFDRAKTLHAEWLALVNRRIEALKGARASEGVELSQRDADALAGDWYRWFTSQYLDTPGSPKRWFNLRETLLDKAGDPETGEVDFDQPEVLSALDTEARASQFLTDRGVALTQTGRTSFLSAVASEYLWAAETLGRRAGGDWSADKHLDQLAPYQTVGTLGRPNGSKGGTGRKEGDTTAQLFEEYCRDRNNKPSTIARQRCVFPVLDRWLKAEGLTAATLDSDAAQRWVDAEVVSTGKAAKTIKDTWIAAPRAVFAWAKRKRRLLIASNPFVDLAVEKHRKSETRETGKSFTEEEAATILRAALAIPTIPRTKAGSIVFAEAAHRWVPWMMAYTGARVGELTQARVCDVTVRVFSASSEGHAVEYAVLLITPEAGPVKNDKARPIPLHPHLIEQGLLDYVEAVRSQQGADAPLFNTGKVGKGRGPGTRGREKLAKWVRSLSARCPSLVDKGVQPNHGWRHTFKVRCRRAGIEPGIRDAICGHAPRSVAERYEHVPVEDMAVAMRIFPRWSV
jgi:integrase